jgi:hypothetical protein
MRRRLPPGISGGSALLLTGGLALAAVAAAASSMLLGERSIELPTPAPKVRESLPRVERFVERKYAGIGGSNDRRLYCKVRYLGNSGVEPRFELYVWEACQEYRAWTNGLAKRTGWSGPAVVTMQPAIGGYQPVAERQPPDGARSETEAMFPRRVMRLVDRMSGTPAVDAMFASLKRRAQLELLGRR